MNRRLWVLGGILAAGVLVLGVLTLRQREPAKIGPGSMGPEDEVTLGIQLAPRMSGELGGLDPGPDAQGMVMTVGDRVARSAASRSPYRFQFHVLADTALVQAFALPGGPIFITRGLLDRLENEAQLAGVLAHEVAHVRARHPAKRLTPGDTTAAAIAEVMGIRYDASEETEADTLAVRILGDAGYDPRALIDVMRILDEATRAGGGEGFTTSHPDPGDRKRVLTDAIARAYPGGVPGTLTQGRWFAPEPPEAPDPMESTDPADSAAILD